MSDMYSIGETAALAVFDLLEDNGVSPHRIVDELDTEDGRRCFEMGLSDALGWGYSQHLERIKDNTKHEPENLVTSGKWLGKRLARLDSDTSIARLMVELLKGELENENNESVKDFAYGFVKGYTDFLEEAKTVLE